MASESITRNDLTEILNGVFPTRYPANNIIATDGSGSDSDVQTILNSLLEYHKYDRDWTDLPLSSTAKAYSTDQKPMYKRYGHIVQVYGAVAPKAQVASGGTLDFATLPQHYRPPRSSLMILCQGSANNKWVLYMGYDGLMSAQRYSTGGTASAMSTSVWLPFSVTFLV